MQLLLSLESGSVCHTHSRQDLKHLVQKEKKKKATKSLILRWPNSPKHLQRSNLLEVRLKVQRNSEQELRKLLRTSLQALVLAGLLRENCWELGLIKVLI